MAYFKPYPRFWFSGGKKFRDLLNQLSSTVRVNQENAPVFAADNMILVGKVSGFLKEDKFVKLANKFFLNDRLHSSIIWRIHTLSWAIDSCKKLDGDFIEFGCYDAKVAEFLIEYNEISKLNKLFFLYDIFDNPPTDKAEKHSPNLYGDVSKRLKKYDFVNVIPGLLPDSFKNNIPEKISFVHLDLNSADTEVSLLEMLFDKVVSGGIIILDDYGHMGYEEQYFKEKAFFNELGYSILELPTGAGMVIKR
tara:strand:- start:690 stop:1439 length:750 start_codon:yes stop_codon:yes gene_type:complete